MHRIFSRVLSSLLVAGVLIISSGCFASFHLTRKVYNFNKGVGDKWVNELVFLVMVVVPVYEIAGAIDILVLNSIEFWTGSNPVSAANEKRSIEPQEGVTVTVDGAWKSVNIAHSHSGRTEEFVFERTEKGTVVKNTSGDILARCVSTDDGGIVLMDATGKVVSTYSSAELEVVARKMAAH
ncbi:MAG: DUF3332 family protein [Ignavibacteriales bacterium]|nr:DUF3332 family protein [Ignavibacteriales bacterium]